MVKLFQTTLDKFQGTTTKSRGRVDPTNKGSYKPNFAEKEMKRKILKTYD